MFLPWRPEDVKPSAARERLQADRCEDISPPILMTEARALSIHHAAVVVADLDQAERFYADLLGLPVLRRWEDAEGRPRSVWLGLGGGAFLAVERAAEPLGHKRSELAPGLHCLALAIRPDEREGFRKRLESAGFPVVRETHFTLYVHDPDGNLIGFSHYPDQGQTTG